MKNSFFVCIIAVMVVVLAVVVWVNLWFQPNIDFSGVPANTTGKPLTPLAAQTVPTVVNGIVTATSIIVGLSGTIIGITFREVFKEDPKGRVFLGLILMMFALAVMFAYGSYVLLTIGFLVFSLKWALSGLLLSLLLFLILVIIILDKLISQAGETHEEGEPTKPEGEPEEKEDKGKSKNVNVFVKLKKPMKKQTFFIGSCV